MKLTQKLKDDLKEALKAKKGLKVLTYRGLLAAIHNKEIELKKAELSDEETISVLESQAKQRHDSIGEFEKGNRADLADKEKKELELIEKYLPEKMSDEEAEKKVSEIIKKTKASGMKDMGMVMGELMKESKGQIDGATGSRIVKEKLSK
ncbi:MAG: GatB/YqeY domain-containing protein [Candidatus Berkelbacteria bacterium]|nr:GatB/YqeY domain-containing protein [Candidatus Berkelbacteria bacterium]